MSDYIFHGFSIVERSNNYVCYFSLQYVAIENKCLTMDIQMKIWDWPRTEEETIRLFQDKEVVPKTTVD